MTTDKPQKAVKASVNDRNSSKLLDKGKLEKENGMKVANITTVKKSTAKKMLSANVNTVEESTKEVTKRSIKIIKNGKLHAKSTTKPLPTP